MNDVKPWDLLNPNEPRSSQKEEDRRMAICEGCEFLKRPAKQCSKCGCFMKLKTKLERGHCPIHKW
jgi:hypothetical protein